MNRISFEPRSIHVDPEGRHLVIYTHPSDKRPAKYEVWLAEKRASEFFCTEMLCSGTITVNGMLK